MKKERIRLSILLISSILLATSFSASAQSIEESITDGSDDVVGFDYETENMELISQNQYIDVENIDIKEVTFTRDGVDAEIVLEVFGDIENRGSIDDTLFGAGLTDPSLTGLDIDTIEYSLTVLTEQDNYQISYVNNECKMSSNEGIINITDFTVNGAMLTIPFTLNSEDDIYTEGNLSALVSYMRLKLEDIMDATEEDFYQGFVWLSDTAPNILEGVYAQATNLALVGKAVQFNASLIDPFTSGVPPYTWEWDFGDGDTASIQNPTHTYDSPGNYTYKVTVTDSQGSTIHDSGVITIKGEDNGGGTPGFEILTVFIALIIALLLLRRKT